MSAPNFNLKTLSSHTNDNNQNKIVTVAHAHLIAEKLAKISLPRLSNNEQTILIDIIEHLVTINKNRNSLDKCAIKFGFSFLMHRYRGNESSLKWREINWAYHSNNHDMLIDFVSRQSHGKMLWEHARQIGLFMWLTDRTKLVSFSIVSFSIHLIRRQVNQFENIARNEYSKSENKNPIDCTLFYLALRKKSVLQGLWRIATWNREQVATIRLLSNNFQEKKWKTAAMKNAYVLLGKHRYDYAAAFFLLADSLKDCVNVILNQLQDIQLAIAVIRVYEGDESLILKELLENKILPLASQDGNPWLASWALWMLHKKDVSIQALMVNKSYLIQIKYTLTLFKPHAYTSLFTSWAPSLRNKVFLDDDPALVTFYSQLRLEILNTAALKISQELEYKLVLHYAKVFSRMGCGLLALDLLRNWKFIASSSLISKCEDSVDMKPISGKNSPIMSDIIMQQPTSSQKTSGYKPSIKLYEEPDSNSLLDSFGF